MNLAQVIPLLPARLKPVVNQAGLLVWTIPPGKRAKPMDFAFRFSSIRLDIFAESIQFGVKLFCMVGTLNYINIFIGEEEISVEELGTAVAVPVWEAGKQADKRNTRNMKTILLFFIILPLRENPECVKG